MAAEVLSKYYGVNLMKEYTTDGKVKHICLDEEDINEKLIQKLGNKFGAYRKKWDAAQNLEKTSDFPLFLQLDINQDCNFQCPHCMLAHEGDIKKYFSAETISEKEYEELIDEAAKYDCPSISLQGTNEPLLSKNLETQIEYAKKNGFIDIMINTNGSALTKNRALKILKSGLTRIRFSLDAVTEEVFNKVRLGGDFKKVIKNIEVFIDLKKELRQELPVIGVNFCVLSENEHEKDSFVDYWKDKVDFVSIQTFTPPTPEKKWNEFYPKKEKKENFNGFKCPQPFQRLVLRNRDITPCCAWYSRELSLGKVGEISLYDAWNSKEMEDLRRLHSEGKWHENPTCKKCVNSIFRLEEFSEGNIEQTKIINFSK